MRVCACLCLLVEEIGVTVYSNSQTSWDRKMDFSYCFAVLNEYVEVYEVVSGITKAL